jgi:hypothetical protein
MSTFKSRLVPRPGVGARMVDFDLSVNCSATRGTAARSGEGGSRSACRDIRSPTTAKLIYLLNHPVRRAIVRFLLRVPSATSTEALQAVSFFGATTSLINFHLDMLVKAAAANRERATNGQYLYSATEHVRLPWVETVLRLTVEED